MIEAFFYYFIAMILAGMEIEMEGKYGWAERIPTPYIVEGRIARIWAYFQGGRPLTVYHIYTTLLTLLIAHIPFAGILFSQGMEWSLGKELAVLSMFFVWVATWDFLWFVLNPYYGIRNFKRDKIWWHSKRKWIKGLFPKDYLNAFLISAGLSIAASILNDESEIFVSYLIYVAIFIALLFVTIVFWAPIYMKWYVKIRSKDDREKANIFHPLSDCAGSN